MPFYGYRQLVLPTDGEFPEPTPPQDGWFGHAESPSHSRLGAEKLHRFLGCHLFLEGGVYIGLGL